MKNIIVTGGSGFIGSNIVNLLERKILTLLFSIKLNLKIVI